MVNMLFNLTAYTTMKISEEPILATGFNPVQHNRLTRILFENDGTNFILTDDDESTINPNVFMIGDTVKHQDDSFAIFTSLERV